MLGYILFAAAALAAGVLLYKSKKENEVRLQEKDAEIGKLQEALRATECPLRDLFFARLLGGGYYSTEEELLWEGEKVSVRFPYRNFIVLGARIEMWGELFRQGEMNRRDANFLLRNTLQNAFPGITEAADVQGVTVAVINLETMPEDGVQAIVQAARASMEVLEAEYGITVTVAISRTYHSPFDIPDAMGDVNHVFDYLQLMDEDRPITAYEDLTYGKLDKNEVSFVEVEARLMGAIRTMDFAGVRMAMHEIFNNSFSETKPTVDVFRFQVYGMVNTMLYMLDEVRESVGVEILEELQPGPRLTGAKTVNELVAVMDDILLRLQQHTEQKRPGGAPAWVERVYAFVEENYKNPNMSVAFVADRFDMTPTYCSKVFREQYNVRLFDLIQLKRLEAAKELMRGNMNLKDIAETVGFTNALAMSRAFKRYEGVSPNRFRESMR